MIERHQDYILQIPSLDPGASIGGQGVLVLDTDAPFLCRAVGIHIAPPPSTRSQFPDVEEGLIGFKNQAGSDLQLIPIQSFQFFAGAFGQGGNYRPLQRQVPYPPGGQIQVSYTNQSNRTLTNLQIIFRGVKLFADGAIPNPTYPPKIRTLDFTYQSGKGTQDDPAIVLGTTDSIFQRIFQVGGDADFVLRAGQAGLWDTTGGGGQYSTDGYTELYIQLMDQNLKPYSNLPIHIDWLLGNGGGTALPGFRALGNSAPGSFFPEIYLPKNAPVYFHLFRQDAPYVAFTDALPVRISLAWIGSKVYA